MKHSGIIDKYLEVKKQHPECLLLFRVGDFYELFYKDAQTAAKIVGLTITTRDKGAANPVPMAGFPYHHLENHLRKLIQAGYRVAVCEQVERTVTGGYTTGQTVTRVVTQGATEVPTATRSKAGQGRVNTKSKAKSITPNATKATGGKGSNREKKPQFTSVGGAVKYGVMRTIRDIAILEDPNPEWKPQVGDVVFIPPRVQEQVEVHNSRWNRTDYVMKQFPTLSPRALLGKVIAYTQADGLVKIQDVLDQIWKVDQDRVKKRFILIESIRPFRGWDVEKEKRLDPLK